MFVASSNRCIGWSATIPLHARIRWALFRMSKHGNQITLYLVCTFPLCRGVAVHTTTPPYSWAPPGPISLQHEGSVPSRCAQDRMGKVTAAWRGVIT